MIEKEAFSGRKKMKNDYRLFWKRNSERTTMLDVWRHARWVCASLIRSRVEPYEVCLQVSFSCYAIDPGFKIYFI